MTSTPPPITIESCRGRRVALVTKEKRPLVSIAGLLSVLLFLVGLATMLFSLVVGALLMVMALLIGHFGRGSSTVMVYPHCGAEGRRV